MNKKQKYKPIDREPNHYGYGLLLYPFLRSDGEEIMMCRMDIKHLKLQHPYLPQRTKKKLDKR